MENEILSISQICSRFSSGKNITATNIKENGNYPVYGGNGLRGYTDTFNFDGECSIIGRQGAYCGNVRYVTGKSYMSEHAVVAVTNPEHNCKYFSYKLSLANLGRFSGQAAQPGLSVTKLLRLKFQMPSKEYQDKIASILSAYDNLIENNAKRIKLLEQMAENLYKEWFVRFRFPGHEHVEMVNGLPKGWKAYKIKDICDINKRMVNTKNAPLTIKYLDTSSITKSSISELQEMLFKESPSRARRMVKENSIVYSTVRPNLKHFGILKCLPTNLIVSTGFAVLDCKDDIANIVYLALASEEMTSYCSSIAEGAVATYPSIKAEELGKITIILPPIEIAEKMNCKLELFLRKINYLELQSQLLTRQRDLLLPRLMSGKLEVKL